MSSFAFVTNMIRRSRKVSVFQGVLITRQQILGYSFLNLPPINWEKLAHQINMIDYYCKP